MLRRVTVLLLLAACGAGEAAPATSAATTTVAGAPVPDAPLPQFDVAAERGLAVVGGLTADLFAPDAPGSWPVVVLLPGGSWDTADPEGIEPLARDLAARGAVVVNATYRLSYPEAFGDAACVVAVARDAAAARGGDPERLVLAGHSAGAHVAAVTALASPAPSPGCAAGPSAPPLAFVGLAGPYEIERFAPVPGLRRMLGGGPEAVPDVWAAADPYTHVTGNPDVAVALVHGRTDLVVLPIFSIGYLAALDAAGREAELYLVPGANHNDLVRPGENATETAGVIFAVAG